MWQECAQASYNQEARFQTQACLTVGLRQRVVAAYAFELTRLSCGEPSHRVLLVERSDLQYAMLLVTDPPYQKEQYNDTQALVSPIILFLATLRSSPHAISSFWAFRRPWSVNRGLTPNFLFFFRRAESRFRT